MRGTAPCVCCVWKKCTGAPPAISHSETRQAVDRTFHFRPDSLPALRSSRHGGPCEEAEADWREAHAQAHQSRP